MANIHSQKKRILRSERERLENRHYTSAIRTYFRRLEAAVAAGDDALADAEHRTLVSDDRQGRQARRAAPQHRRPQEVPRLPRSPRRLRVAAPLLRARCSRSPHPRRLELLALGDQRLRARACSSRRRSWSVALAAISRVQRAPRARRASRSRAPGARPPCARRAGPRRRRAAAPARAPSCRARAGGRRRAARARAARLAARDSRYCSIPRGRWRSSPSAVSAWTSSQTRSTK